MKSIKSAAKLRDPSTIIAQLILTTLNIDKIQYVSDPIDVRKRGISFFF